jgi:hypothetical protein
MIFQPATEARSSQHEAVEPSMVIVVEKGDTAANRFEDIALGIDAPQIPGKVRPACLAISVNFASKGRPERFPFGCARTLRVDIPCANTRGAKIHGPRV